MQRGYTQALAAGAVHVGGYVALAAGSEFVTSWFFQWAWWSYIVAVDGVVYAKRGNSLLRSRGRECVVLALLSALVWWHFETWNLRLQDWYYIRAHPSFLWRVVRYNLAFATVIPGVLETYDLLRAWNLPRRVAVRPLRLRPAVWQVSAGAGAVSCLAALLWPRHAFPLVWGCYALLLDPLNARWGGRSFIVDWSRGDLTRLCRMLLAGLICGGLWESWNFWARAKWLYTVPFFEQWKVFEMPLLGFLGFPPFAIQLACITTFATLLRGVPGWAAEGEPPTRGPIVPPRIWRTAVVIAVAYIGVQMVLTDRYTVGSHYLRLGESPLVETAAGKALAGAGYAYPVDVVRDLETARGRLAVAEALAGIAGTMEEALGPVLVAALPAVGSENAFHLAGMGIGSIGALAAADPGWLSRTFPVLASQDGGGSPMLPLRRAQLWVRQAQRAHQRSP